MSTELGTTEGIKSRELVHFVTQQTRFALVNNILQHPEQLPSMYELEELNPSVSDATVYKHIQKLIDAGIVEEVALNDDQRRQGYPWKFYGLTEEGREFLEATTCSPPKRHSNRSTKPSRTNPRRWSSTRTHPALRRCRHSWKFTHRKRGILRVQRTDQFRRSAMTATTTMGLHPVWDMKIIAERRQLDHPRTTGYHTPQFKCNELPVLDPIDHTPQSICNSSPLNRQTSTTPPFHL